MGKTHLLPIGRLPEQAVFYFSSLTELAGFSVVASATTLGVTFERGGGGRTTLTHGHPQHVTSWTPQEEARLKGVMRALQMLGGLRLSLLGRGLGSGVYCTSKFFYHLEYRLPIPSAKIRLLNSAITALMSDKHRDGRPSFSMRSLWRWRPAAPSTVAWAPSRGMHTWPHVRRGGARGSWCRLSRSRGPVSSTPSCLWSAARKRTPSCFLTSTRTCATLSPGCSGCLPRWVRTVVYI